jgi:LmbE family N-acetylglucosaminyl deacetylase
MQRLFPEVLVIRSVTHSPKGIDRPAMAGLRVARRALRMTARAGRAELHAADALALTLGRLPGGKAAVPDYEPGAPVIVLSPHLDDVVFGCWSVLTQSHPVNVVNVFAGVPRRGSVTHGDRLAGATDSSARMEGRREEDANALECAGLKPRNLDLLAFGYRRFAPSVAAVSDAILREVSSASRVVAPVGIGAHPDHHLIRRIALRWAEAGMPATFFADIPYAVNYGWPSWVDGSRASPFVDVDEYWRSFVDGELALTRENAEVIELDDATMDAKLRAMRAYASQYPWLAGGSRDWLADPRVLRYEVLWTAR